MNTSAKPPIPIRITSLAGFAGSGIILLGCLISGLAYTGRTGESYSLLNHFISELGELRYSELALVFNLSLIIGGLSFSVFMQGIAVLFTNWMRYVMGVLGLITGISGILVGFFPMDYLVPHGIVAMTFFYVGMISVAVFSIYVLFSRRGEFPRWFVAPGLVTAAVFFSFLFLSEPPESSETILDAGTDFLVNRPDVWMVPILEWATLFAIIAWVVWMSGYLWQRAQQASD